MRTLIGQILIAALVLATGEAFRRAAHVEDGLAHAQQALATLSPDTADAGYSAVEEEIGLAARLPIVGPPLLADVRKQRAMVAYWSANYSGVPSDEAQLAADDTNPELIFLAGNAAYRTVAGRRAGQEGAQDLEAVLRVYTMFLKKDPDNVDGAYNYEYVVRLRNIVAKMRASGTARPPQSDPSMHGQEGSPPPDTQTEQFNVIVPLRPEERGDMMKAGSGGPRQRKG